MAGMGEKFRDGKFRVRSFGDSEQSLKSRNCSLCPNDFRMLMQRFSHGPVF